MITPAEFDGSPEERRSNFMSHRWFASDEDNSPSCLTCGTDAASISAEWPCGADVPRK